MSLPRSRGLGWTPGAELRHVVIIAAGLLFSGTALLVAMLTRLPLSYPLAVGLTAVAAVFYMERNVLARPAVRHRVLTGVLGGFVGLVGYDLTRAVVLLTGLGRVWRFDTLRLFGELLVGDGAPPFVIWAAGTAFHAVNGLAFGAVYGLLAASAPWWYGIGWALVLEAFMVTLYPGWLHVAAVGEFTSLTLAGHLVYGTLLGGTVARRARHGGA